MEVLLKTDLLSARRELAPTIAVLDWTADGVRLHAQVDDLTWFAQELARLPFAFEIRKPPGLRRALRAVARRLLELAGERPGSKQNALPERSRR